jgi:hypothetical protein
VISHFQPEIDHLVDDILVLILIWDVTARSSPFKEEILFLKAGEPNSHKETYHHGTKVISQVLRVYR